MVVRPVLFCFVFLTFVWLTFYPFTSSLRTCETEQTPPVRNGVGPRFPRSLRQAVSSAVARTTRAPGAHFCFGVFSVFPFSGFLLPALSLHDRFLELGFGFVVFRFM